MWSNLFYICVFVVFVLWSSPNHATINLVACLQKKKTTESQLHSLGFGPRCENQSDTHVASLPCQILSTLTRENIPLTLRNQFSRLGPTLSLKLKSIKVCKCYLVVFLSGHLYSIGVWFDADTITNTVNTCLIRDWTTSSRVNNHCTLNSEHYWVDIWI